MPNTTPARDALLRAAAEEIIDRGYTAASMSSIAARLGMTKGSLAYHFPAKRDLAVALAEHLDETLRVARHDARTAFPASGLRALVAYVFNVGERCKDLEIAAGAVLVFDPVNNRLDLPPSITLLRSHLEGFVTQADTADERRPGAPDPETASRLATVYMIGAFVFQHHHTTDQREDLRGVSMLLDGIGARGTAEVTRDVAAAQVRGQVSFPPVYDPLGTGQRR